eukprot:8237244-Pyramimonas_sp.AAC.1
MYRVVCGHAREERSQFVKLTDKDNAAAQRSHPDYLREVCDCIAQDASPSVKGRRRPFPAFRSDSTDESGGDESDDEVTVISRSLDAAKFKAIIALSDVSTVVADRYYRGENGLAVA